MSRSEPGTRATVHGVGAALLTLLLASGARADDELPWVAFVHVVDGGKIGIGPKLVPLVQQSLLKAEVNVVAPEELGAVAQAQGVARTSWDRPGALASVAAALRVDWLLFARVTSTSKRSYEVELFAVAPLTGDVVASERLEVAGDVARARAGPGPSWSSVDALVRRLITSLPAKSAAPEPTHATSPTSPTGATGATSPTSPTGTNPTATTTPAPPATTSPGVPPPDSTNWGDIALYTGGGLAGVAAVGAVVFGAVAAAGAWDTSEALVTLPKGSPEREAREQSSLEQAVVADVSYGAALILGGVAATLLTLGALDE